MKTFNPASKRALLVQTLGVQGLILATVGGLLLSEGRATAVRELEQYKWRHNDFTPALIRERVPDLNELTFTESDPRLMPLLSQAHLDPETAYWIFDQHGNIVWASEDAHPHGPKPLHEAETTAWAIQGVFDSGAEVKRGVGESGTELATRHSLPNGFSFFTLEPSPERTMFVRGTVLGMFLRITAAGAATLSLTALITLLIMRRYESQIERINAQLEDEVERQVETSTLRLHAMIFGLAKLADFRDSDTGAHLDRICEYAAALARELAPERPEINDVWIENLRLAASLHDIGKVGVPDGVLLKPGDLTKEERQVIEQHPLFGADTLIAVRRRLGDSPLLNLSIEIALQHHERWDGTGYPFGLTGDQISLSARIVAVADVYDALRSVRVYKASLSHVQAVEVIEEGSGKHFDPAIVRAFLRIEPEFASIAERWTGPLTRSPSGLRKAA